MNTCTIEGCARPVLARGFCAPHYSTWHRAQRKYRLVCSQCGVEFDADRRTRSYCSRTCSSKNAIHGRVPWNKKPRPLVLYTGPVIPLTRQVHHVRTSHRLTSGQCRTCKQWFVSQHLDVTCSTPCAKRYRRDQAHAAEHRRKARKRQAFVANVYRKKIFERDGYRCHLCGKKTKKDQVVPHPKAPTIDHVIPLAVGGTHEPSNCRTACFLCNATKGAGGGGEQLLLIA